VAYLSGVSSYYTVRVIERRLDDIIVQSTDELQSYLIGNLNTKFDIFPLIRKTRREEWACKALYKGDVLIFIDDIPCGLVAPRTLWRSLLGVPGSLDCFNPFIFRIFVYIALFTSLFLPSLYMVAVSYRLDWLSSEFSNYLNSIRGTVIFSAFIEVLILEFLVELIRESLLANPPKNGLAVFIISTIAIGETLTTWSIFNPLLVMIVSSSLMFSFLIPDYLTIHSLRILKFLMLITTGMFGIYGFALLLMLTTVNIIILIRSGVPYSPFGWYELIHAFLWERRKRLLKSK